MNHTGNRVLGGHLLPSMWIARLHTAASSGTNELGSRFSGLMIQPQPNGTARLLGAQHGRETYREDVGDVRRQTWKPTRKGTGKPVAAENHGLGPCRLSARSLIGQSTGLLSRLVQVRILPGGPIRDLR